MSHDEQEQNIGPGRSVSAAWGAVFCWAGIYLLRLLAGLFVGAIVAGIHSALSISGAFNDSFTSGVFVALLTLVLAIASTVFLPLWRGLEKESIRGRVEAVVATRILLIPASVFQVFVALIGRPELGIANFFFIVGVCFLVTLALDIERRRQFGMLLIAGAQVIIFGFVTLMMGPDTRTDAWEVRAAWCLGAVPSIVIMLILFMRCSRVVRTGSCVDAISAVHAVQDAPLNDSPSGVEHPIDAPSITVQSDAESTYFYVGPDNEPVGPISRTVLCQLRRSGAISDETFVAQEGESDWVPLRECLHELDATVT